MHSLPPLPVPPEVCREIAPPLLSWFARNKRDLPWRRTYDPYQVWVSEIMLQQTQMERATAYFERFLGRFPGMEHLARASEDELFRAWQGLGYYSRARNMLRAARETMERHGGRLPRDVATLRRLPGIGPYTAAAVASIAYQQDVVLVDANVSRLFARLCDVDIPIKDKEAQQRVEALARAHLPQGRAREYNQALMELGALVCRPRQPLCGECPVAEACEARRLDIVGERPVTSKRAEITHLEVATGVLVHQGRVFVQKRPATGPWAGLWEFPGGRVEEEESPAEAVVREFLEETEMEVAVEDQIGVVRHGYTRYRVTLHCFLCSPAQETPRYALHAAQEAQWRPMRELDGLAFPAGHRKLIDLLKRDVRFCSRLFPGALQARRNPCP